MPALRNPDLPPRSLINEKGALWELPDSVRDLFCCPKHRCELERAECFWVCQNLICRAVPDAHIMVRLTARLLAGDDPGARRLAEARARSLFRRARLRAQFLFRSARADDWRAGRLFVAERGTRHERARETDLRPGH